MSPTLEPIHRLAQGVRVHGPALLSGMPEPHDELMSLVWGPRFDREHATVSYTHLRAHET